MILKSLHDNYRIISKPRQTITQPLQMPLQHHNKTTTKQRQNHYNIFTMQLPNLYITIQNHYNPLHKHTQTISKPFQNHYKIIQTITQP